MASPIGAGHLAFVKGDFFLERFAEAHDDAALHTTVELPRVDDLAAVDTDGELGHLHNSSSWNDGNLGDTHPVSIRAHDDAHAAAGHRNSPSPAGAAARRGPRLPCCRFGGGVENV